MAATRNMSAVARKGRTFDLPDGRKIELRALTISDLAFIEEEAVQAAKRELILTYTRNADLLPEEDRKSAVREAFKRAEDMRIDNLPYVEIKAPVILNGELQYHAETGVQLTTILKIDYAYYWIDHTVAGKLCEIWLSMRASLPLLTRDEAADIFAAYNSEQLVNEAASAVDDLSRPTLGNVSPPPIAEPVGATGRGGSQRRSWIGRVWRGVCSRIRWGGSRPLTLSA